MVPRPARVSQFFGLFVAYVVILFASFSYDIFQVTGKLRSEHIGSDSYLVLNRLQLAVEGVEFWHPLAIYAPAKGHEMYTSSVGLQGIVLGGLLRATGLDPVRFSQLAASGCALLTAGVLAIFLVSAARIFGTLAANIGVFLTALSPVLLSFAPSLYWCTFLLFAPFVCVWTLYPLCAASWKGRLALLSAVFTLVLLKSLCGYEYITSVVLSTLGPVVFHRCRAGDFRRRWAELLTWPAVGSAAFAAALVLHVVQLQHFLGGGAIDTIVDRARCRTFAGDARLETPMVFASSLNSLLPENVAYPVNCFLRYFELPAMILPGGCQEIDFRTPVVYGLGMLFYGLVPKRKPPRQLRSLTWAVGCGLAASLSWQVCAVNHMCVHFHLNQIVFWIPFLPMAVVMMGYSLQQLAARCKVAGPIVRLMAPGCLLLVALSSLRHVDGQVAQQVAASIAQDRVLAAVCRPELADTPTGCVSIVDEASRGAAACTSELARSSLAASVHKLPDLVVRGWFVDTQAPGEPKTMVAMQGDQVVPIRDLTFHDRPDVSLHLNMHAPQAGFTLCVPSLPGGNNAPIRLFVAAGKDFSKIAQLHLP